MLWMLLQSRGSFGLGVLILLHLLRLKLQLADSFLHLYQLGLQLRDDLEFSPQRIYFPTKLLVLLIG